LQLQPRPRPAPPRTVVRLAGALVAAALCCGAASAGAETAAGRLHLFPCSWPPAAPAAWGLTAPAVGDCAGSAAAAGSAAGTGGRGTRIEATPAAGQPPTVGRFALRVAKDVGPLFAAPLHFDRRGWAWFGAGLALVGTARVFDDRLRVAVRRDSDPEDLRFPRAYRPLGQEGGLALLGAAWITGRALDKPGVVATAQDGLEATLLAAGVISPLLKAATGRARPRQGQGSGSFHSFGGDASFPSGEATEAFAIAAAVAAHTDRKWLEATAWTLAAGTAWERMRLDAHWASDVVAGALLGTAVGRWVVHRHQPRRTADFSLDVVPELGGGRYGLGVRLAFDGVGRR
jgi:membrane-associated phospholipid phosphatase